MRFFRFKDNILFMMYIGKIKPRKSRELSALILLVTIATITFITILLNGKYSSKIDVNGVVVREDISKIYAGESGIVEVIYFKDGDFVDKGDVIFKINDSSSNYSNIVSDSSLKKQIDSIKKLMDDELNSHSKKIKLIQSDSKSKINLIKVVSNEIEILNDTIDLLKKDLEIIENREGRILSLISKGVMAKDGRDSISLEKQGKIKEIKLSRIEISSRVKEKLNLELDVENIALQLIELDKNHKIEIEQLTERLNAYKLRDSYYVRSTKSGYINNIDSYQNKFVMDGDILATVKNVSENKLYIKLYSDSESLSYARFNNTVTLRIEAFPYESYGVLKGEIVRVSPTKINDSTGDMRFAIIVKINSKFGNIEEDWLLDGMKVIGTYSGNEMSLVEWLFLPVVKGIKRNPGYWG